jgi:cell division protein FtsB
VKRFLIVPALVAAALVWALLDQESGIRAWLRLRAELAEASARIAGLEAENAALRAQVESLRDDPVALEAAIRDELELARPREIIVKLPRGTSDRDDAKPRIP